MLVTLDTAAIVREPAVAVVARPQFAEPAHLRVHRAGDAGDAERLAEFGARLTTSSQQNPAGRDTREFVASLVRGPLVAALAHVHYTLLIEGVSRSLTETLRLRAPMLSVTGTSHRYLDESQLQFVLPPALAGDEALESTWSAQMAETARAYHALVQALMTRHGWVNDKVQRRRMAREGAAALLPQCLATTLLVSGSVPAWRQLLATSGGEGAEREWRRVVVSLARVLRDEAPALFADVSIVRGSDQLDMVQVMPTEPAGDAP